MVKDFLTISKTFIAVGSYLTYMKESLLSVLQRQQLKGSKYLENKGSMHLAEECSYYDLG